MSAIPPIYVRWSRYSCTNSHLHHPANRNSTNYYVTLLAAEADSHVELTARTRSALLSTCMPLSTRIILYNSPVGCCSTDGHVMFIGHPKRSAVRGACSMLSSQRLCHNCTHWLWATITRPLLLLRYVALNNHTPTFKGYLAYDL